MTKSSVQSRSTSPSAGRRDSGVTLAGLRAFVAVAEARSFSLGAKQLGLTQPSVSIQVAALENACDLLLCRRKPEFELTDAGQALFLRARTIVSGVEEFEASVAHLQATPRRLVLGVSVPHVAMPLLASFRKACPHVQVATVMGNTGALLDGLNRCRIDIGIMTLIEPNPGFECALICRPRLMVCMRSDDLMASKPSLRLSDIASRPLVMRESGSQTRALLEAMLAEAGLDVAEKTELGSREAMREAVAAGIGIGVMFENEQGSDARLTLVPLQEVGARPAVYAVTLRESMGVPAVRSFIEHVRLTKVVAVAPRLHRPRR